MKTDRSALLVVGVAAVVLIGSLGLVVGISALDSSEPEGNESTDSADSVAAGDENTQDSDGADDEQGASDGTDDETSSSDDTADQVEFDHDDPIELDPTDAVISGTVDVEAGTNLTVQLRTVSGEESPFFLAEGTTTGEDGSFAVEFDVIGVAPGTEAEVVVTVAGEDEQLGNASVTVTEPSEELPDDEETSDRVEFDHDDPIELDPADAVISGTADVEAGTNLTVQLSSAAGEESPFFVTETTTVADDGSFEVEFGIDNSTTAPGTEAEVSVSVAGEDEPLGIADVIVTEASEEPTSAESAVTFDQDAPIELDPDDPVISGTVEDVETGTNLSSRLASDEGAESPFFLTTTVTVDEDGTFEIEFDLSDIDPESDAEATVTVRVQEEPERSGQAAVVVR